MGSTRYEQKLDQVAAAIQARGLAQPSQIRQDTGISQGYISDLLLVLMYRGKVKATPKGYVVAGEVEGSGGVVVAAGGGMDRGPGRIRHGCSGGIGQAR